MAEAYIEDFKEAPKANAFAPLAEALYEAGEGKSIRIPTTVGERAKVRRAFGEAANSLSDPQTARLRQRFIGDKVVDEADLELSEDDVEITLVFTLGPKQVRPGRPRKDAAEAAPAKAKK